MECALEPARAGSGPQLDARVGERPAQPRPQDLPREMVQEILPESRPSSSPLRTIQEAARALISHLSSANSLTAAALAVVLSFLYAPVLASAAKTWFIDSNYAHGVFIPPVCLWLLWMQRKQLRSIRTEPSNWGLLPLASGLLLEVFGCVIGSNSLALLSLIPCLSGLVILLYGAQVWRAVRFPICYLALAARLPFGLTETLSQWVQRISTDGAAWLLRAMDYPVTQQGNILTLSGISLEVADVCSGFKKLIAMMAFALLYGYVFRISNGRRLLLLLAATPIAVMANTLRIGALAAIAASRGATALHHAHGPAEIVVLVVAFFCFIQLGKWLGCKEFRFIG